jgi:CheY-like chemotaxis protein
VDCWIGVTEERGRRVVRLAGRFCEQQVPELLQACEHSTALSLDLSDLLYTDVAGLEALRRIRDRGAMLVGVSGYIQLKLDSRPRGESGNRRSKP